MCSPVSAKNVPGVGTVLVNSQGRTLYMLTSEKGDKITCTASSGCLHALPETDLPSGTTKPTAGSGVQSSLLGTVKGPAGTTVTYNGHPLYTFVSDTKGKPTSGEGQHGFYAVSPAGSKVTKTTTTTTTTTTSSKFTAPGGGQGY